jgi:4'-phosphopantetheinyl transferase
MKENLISSTINLSRADLWLSKRPELPYNEVHIWQADLDAMDWPENRSLGLLSQDEYERAGRFRFARDRNRFMTGRQLLRILLSAYLKTDLMGVSFHYSPNGKPSLGNGHDASEIKFNVSHSDRMALFGFVRRRELGVDIERIERDVGIREIAGRFFSYAEQQAFEQVPAELKQETFFRCWTRKEAFVKAKGNGLSLPLDQFDVSLLPKQSAELLRTWPDPEERDRWSMWDLDVGPGYAGALVVEGKGMKLSRVLLLPQSRTLDTASAT